MPLVIDCSITMAWLLPDEDSERANRALSIALTGTAAVPRLWTYEVQNALLVALRRKRVDVEFVTDAISALRSLPLTVHDPPFLGREVALAGIYGLTAYDAAYLGTARDTHATLATLDDSLADAAAKCGVALL